MAYAHKYNLQFTNLKGNTYRAEIWQDEYLGPIIEKHLAGNPMELVRDNSECMLGTSLRLGIEADSADTFGLEDLYSENPRKNRLDLYKNNVLAWRGFIQPEQYSDPYVAPPFDIYVTATDGLGTLKNFDFNLSGLNSELAILNHCLSYLNVDLQVGIAIYMHEESMDSTRSPMAQSYLYAENFYQDGDPMTCYDVIAKLLYGYDKNTFITQEDGRWKVFRKIDIERDLVVYNYESTYVATVSPPTLRQLNSVQVGDVWPVGNLNREIRPPLKSIVLKENYQKKYTIVPHGIFTHSEFDYHVYPDGSKKYTKSKYWKSDYQSTLAIPPAFYENLVGLRITNIAQWISCTENVAVSQSTLPIYIQIKYRSTRSYQNIGLEVEIKCGTDSLKEEGWNGTTDIVLDDTGGMLSTFTILADGFPSSGDLKFRFNSHVQDWDETVNEVYEIRVGFDSEEIAVPSGRDTTVLINEYGTRREEIDLITSIPAGNSLPVQYLGGKRTSAGAVLGAWTQTASVAAASDLIVLISRSIASDNRMALQVLNGIIEGANLSFGSIIQNAINSNRKFFIREGTYNLFTEEINATLEEVLGFVDMSYTINEKEIYADNKNAQLAANNNTDYVVYGAGIGVGLRINSLPTATDYENAYVVIDKVGAASAEKIPLNAVLNDLFELVPNNGSPYIRAKYSFASVGTLKAYEAGGNIPGLWDALPIASASQLGGVKVGSNLTVDPDGTIHAQAASGGVTSYNDLTDVPVSFPPSAHTHPYRPDTWNPTWNDVQSKPSTFTPSAHTHPYRPDTWTPTWNEVQSKPSTFPPSTHTHNYEPAFTKNTAFNKDFAGSGVAATVARSDHNHAAAYEPKNTNIQTHISSQANPHNVTAAQTGAYHSGNANKSDVNWTCLNLTAHGTVMAYQTSDPRLKDVSGTLNNVLELLNRLDLYSFNYNDKARELMGQQAGKSAGVMATQLNDMPELAHLVGTIYDKYLGVNYEGFIPYILAAIQELSQQLNRIENGTTTH